MHAYIIWGGTSLKRLSYIEKLYDSWQVSKFDRVTIGDVLPSIGIEEVRALFTKLHLKPLASPLTALSIFNAARLTIPAQQALLKTLEEPPPHVRIILEMESKDSLLATIQSRCQLIELPRDEDEKQESQYGELIEKLLGATPGAAISGIDTFLTTRQEAPKQIRGLILAARLLLINSQSSGQRKRLSSLIHRLLYIQTLAGNNVNPQLLFDSLFLPVTSQIY